MGLLDALGIRIPTPEEWWQLGQSLGLSPVLSLYPFDEDACYRRLERARIPIGLGVPPHFRHHLCGERRGADVTVVQYETGSGSSTIAWTAAIARVDPPLWLGLQIRREHLLDSVFGGRDLQLGDPAIDERLRVSSFDPARTTQLLSPLDSEARGALEYMKSLTLSHALSVADTFVRVGRTGVHTDPGTVSPMLDAAVSLATWLSARRRRVPPNQGEIVDLPAWERFTTAHGLELDPWRIVARGAVPGARMEIGLELEGQRAFIVLVVRFSQPSLLPFEVVRTQTPAFLQGVFSQDIRVGDREVDDAYRIAGPDPNRIRALIGQPGVIEVLRRAARLSTSVQLGPNGLDLRIERGMPREEDLAMLTSMATTLAAELTAGPPAQGPYR